MVEKTDTHRTRIKVCGLTRPEDVEAAIGSGADAIGLIFAPSARQVTLEQAEALAAIAPPGVARIGVFVDADPAFIEEAVQRAGLTAVQLCGTESPEVCSAVSVPVIKVLGVGTDFGWEKAEPYRDQAAALLLDTYVAGKAGGTSQAFAWRTLGAAPVWAPLYVAGGLTPHNVGEAIRVLRPFAVDVSSGVESAPGIKSADKIAAFCAAVRAADQEEDE